MHNGDDALQPDPRKVLVGRIIHQLIRRGWRPPRQLPPRGVGNLLEDLENAGKRGQTLNLSPGETRVIQLTAEGHSAKVIAEKLYLAEDTIKSTQKKVRRKLGARNSTHAVVMAMREGVIE